jgi:hypothetical protein
MLVLVKKGKLTTPVLIMGPFVSRGSLTKLWMRGKSPHELDGLIHEQAEF